ncbi:dicarboxylate transporter/tellurite-resistance protein TehA [Actinobacillus succinogenes]|uniref:C4-dicarboxylate transporter/malic acid transport protein n=1 Tax=Actinobacillus succinogenes (strain ATCC 55618 / DSM 22257 / CCUG 43843 / 130Z) TaxID=339671 RepID=A6VKF8_ACTSZ|nr:dicarboxylate transporter/tellurite-resistance protein TehA [Actinobacillus succinogenes]ABR73455.1 C4-dicarboxylate transporter/malic acid transport protein [Actinobacillus succinogenes 130Z]PHI40083.1 dicarboxylate transporter/tellurite-resistance protein TehA [Actinobacillus succinogenes]
MFLKTPLPVNYFSIVLGLAALGLAWRYGASVALFPAWVGETVIAAAGLIWLGLMTAYGYKWVKFPETAQSELTHPITGSFVSLVPITTLLICVGIRPHFSSLSTVLLVFGIIGQLGFSAYFTARLWQGTHPAEATTPALYLPTVATNFVSTIALGDIGLKDFGMIFLGAGIFSWFFIDGAIQQRLRNLTAIPNAVRPALGIQFAPAIVGCAAYLSVNGGEIDTFAKLLIGYSLLQFLFLARLFPWIAQHGVSLSYWAFSFGLASMAGVGLRIYHGVENQPFGWLGYVMFVVGTTFIALLTAGTLWLMVKKIRRT